MNYKKYPRINNITILNDYKIEIIFDNFITKIVDFEFKLEADVYKPLLDLNLFKSAHVDVGGYGISWNDDIDMSEYELWNIGIKK